VVIELSPTEGEAGNARKLLSSFRPGCFSRDPSMGPGWGSRRIAPDRKRREVPTMLPSVIWEQTHVHAFTLTW